MYLFLPLISKLYWHMVVTVSCKEFHLKTHVFDFFITEHIISLGYGYEHVKIKSFRLFIGVCCIIQFFKSTCERRFIFVNGYFSMFFLWPKISSGILKYEVLKVKKAHLLYQFYTCQNS